jgi:hypothetical protein
MEKNKVLGLVFFGDEITEKDRVNTERKRKKSNLIMMKLIC